LLSLATKTRKKEKVFLDYQPRSLKAHLKQADKKNAFYCLCVGENELKNNSIWVKNLITKEEKNLHVNEFCV
nr:histidine--tRNA ligase [Campylobacteraceae bacterium]